jgi:hypothetical protein
MKFFRLDLLTLLISLFILNSCKNQDTVGLGVNSSTQISGALVDTSTVTINTVREDSVVTSGPLSKTPLAYFNDPIFGRTESNILTDLNLPGATAYVLPSGTISIDSTRLVLGFADGFYGDSVASSYKINVYQAKTKYNTSVAYYSNTLLGDYSSQALLGTLTFKARTHDSIKIYDILTGKPDTLKKVKAQIRIPINNNFVISNFFNASSTTLASNAVFLNSVKGLYLTLDKTQTTGAGGVFMLSTADTLAIYCKIVNGTTIDTTQIMLPIKNLAASINHTYTTTITEELNNTTSSRSTFYLQGLAGLRAKVSFPSLLLNLRNNLLKKDSDIVLNRAELVVTPGPSTNIPYRALPKLTMYSLDIAHQRISIQDASTSDPRAGGVSIFGGYFNPTRNQYHFVVTAYLQDLLSKKTVDYGTYIAPVDTTNTSTVDIAATPQVGARTVAVGSDKNSTYKIKLNIIYTKIKK